MTPGECLIGDSGSIGRQPVQVTPGVAQGSDSRRHPYKYYLTNIIQGRMTGFFFLFLGAPQLEHPRSLEDFCHFVNFLENPGAWGLLSSLLCYLWLHIVFWYFYESVVDVVVVVVD